MFYEKLLKMRKLSIFRAFRRISKTIRNKYKTRLLFILKLDEPCYLEIDADCSISIDLDIQNEGCSSFLKFYYQTFDENDEAQIFESIEICNTDSCPDLENGLRLAFLASSFQLF